MEDRPGRWERSRRRPEGGWSRGARRPPEGDQHGCAHYQALESVRRDLHDQVGSTLAGMAVQLELAGRLLGLDTDTAHTVLSELRSDITDLIAKVRRIGEGRGNQHHVKNMQAALDYLIRQANRAVAPRQEFSLDFDPQVSQVPDEIRSAAFWIVWEAVTNVLKHSAAHRCTVALCVRDCTLQLRVEDDGRVPMRSKSEGSGLANMSARAAEQGGWCAAGPREPAGFVVAAGFPLPETEG